MVLTLLAGMLPGIGVDGRPVCGVHTIRADDRALALVHEGG